MRASVAAEVICVRVCVCVCVCARTRACVCVCVCKKQKRDTIFVVNNKISPLAFNSKGLISFLVWRHPFSFAAGAFFHYCFASGGLLIHLEKKNKFEVFGF